MDNILALNPYFPLLSWLDFLSLTKLRPAKKELKCAIFKGEHLLVRRRGFAKPPNIILCWLSFFCENSGSIERKGAETIWTIVKYDWKSQQVFLYGKYLLNVLQQCAKATEQTPSFWWKFFSAVTRIQKHINHVFFLAVSSSDKRIKGFVHARTVDFTRLNLLCDKWDRVFGEKTLSEFLSIAKKCEEGTIVPKSCLF